MTDLVNATLDEAGVMARVLEAANALKAAPDGTHHLYFHGVMSMGQC